MAASIQVLLVDDEPDFLEPLSFWLISKDYDVKTAVSGADALRMITELKPDVVFLDVKMPEMDGIETLRRIRASNKTLPVILMTAAVDDEEKFSGARALGISGFFPKGSGLEQFAQALKVALRMLPQTQPATSSPEDDPTPRNTLLAFFRKVLRKLTPFPR